MVTKIILVALLMVSVITGGNAFARGGGGGHGGGGHSGGGYSGGSHSSGSHSGGGHSGGSHSTGISHHSGSQGKHAAGGVTFKHNKEGTYKSGYPRVERSQGAKHEFLREHGYTKVPNGYEVDHIRPLSQGGSDSPSNMQLLSTEAHHQKTASERRKD